MSEPYSTRHLTYGFIALFTAISFHALGIVWLKQLDLSSSLSNWHSDIGLHHALTMEPILDEEQIVKRNLQLAQAFQQLKELPDREMTEAKDEISLLSVEFTDLEFEDNQLSLLSDAADQDWQLNEAEQGTEGFLAEANKSSAALLEQAHDPRQELRPSELKPSAREMLQPDHRQITQELVRVTELMPTAPVKSTLDQIQIGESTRHVRLNAPLMASGLAPQSLESDLEPQLSAGELSGREGSYAGLKAPGSKSKQTDQLFLPQVHKKPKEVVTCALPVPHPTLVKRSANNQNSISSDQFQLAADYTLKDEGEGYLFRLQLLPNKQAALPRLHRNLYFFVDRTPGISAQRYELSKQAILQALRYLNEDDSFNILVFDQQVTMMAPQNLPGTDEQKRRAELFLQNQPYNRIMSDLYSSLGTIVPQEAKEDEVNLAILLSDGTTSLPPEQQRRLISKWTQRNSGKLIVYAVALPQGNHLALLESLCTFNHGKLFVSPNLSAMTQTVAGLVQGLQPIGKDLVISVVPSDPEQMIALSPPNSRLPPLYEKLPFVLYGTANRIDDFYIFIQGRYYGKRLDMKHKVSLAASDKGNDQALKRAWALQKAQVYYERYLKEGKQQYLTLAQQLLTPYQLPLAFQ